MNEKNTVKNIWLWRTTIEWINVARLWQPLMLIFHEKLKWSQSQQIWSYAVIQIWSHSVKDYANADRDDRTLFSISLFNYISNSLVIHNSKNHFSNWVFSTSFSENPLSPSSSQENNCLLILTNVISSELIRVEKLSLSSRDQIDYAHAPILILLWPLMFTIFSDLDRLADVNLLNRLADVNRSILLGVWTGGVWIQSLLSCQAVSSGKKGIFYWSLSLYTGRDYQPRWFKFHNPQLTGLT